MILNTYAILDVFVSLLRFGLALPIVWLALSSLAHRSLERDLGGRSAREDRFYLLFLSAGVLLVLNVLAWPLFYLLLQSYASEWPGVMCIYGVTRIGAGTVGRSRYLPGLLEALQATKPLVVFLSGAWFVLHLVNRRTQTAPLTGRVLIGLLLTALIAGLDATIELTYLFTPKKEEHLASGCCTIVLDRDTSPGRILPPEWLGKNPPSWLYPGFFVANACLVAALYARARVCQNGVALRWFVPLSLATALVLVFNWVFIVELVTPSVLRSPGHHCPYDLVSRAPPSVVAIALFVVGGFCVGWEGCIACLGRGPEVSPHVNGLASTLLHLAAFGFAAGVLILAVELAVV